ncbi:MAG: hypothetical protein KKA32_11835 [Actinobacteria bacterium]|nr:hypothetical protein [Actinomycetota bacterium]
MGAFADTAGATSKVVVGALVAAAVVLFGVSVAGGTAALRAYQATSTTTTVASAVIATEGQGVTGALVSGDDKRSTSTAAPRSTAPPTTVPPTTRTTAGTIGTTRTTVLVDTTPPPTPTLVYPDNGAIIDRGKVSLGWRAVKDPSGVLYRVEVQHYDGKTYVPTRTYNDLSATTLGRTMTAMSERWRVSAVDGRGNWSAPGRWRTMTQPLSIVVPMTPYITTTTIMLY